MGEFHSTVKNINFDQEDLRGGHPNPDRLDTETDSMQLATVANEDESVRVIPPSNKLAT